MLKPCARRTLLLSIDRSEQLFHGVSDAWLEKSERKIIYWVWLYRWPIEPYHTRPQTAFVKSGNQENLAKPQPRRSGWRSQGVEGIDIVTEI